MNRLLSRFRPMGLVRALFSATLVSAFGASSFGALVNFNPAGTGAAGAVPASTFDELPGNALAQGAVPLISALAATGGTTVPFALYYQANVRVLAADGVTEINTTANPITAVAKFFETATVTAGSSTVTFNLAANQAGAYFDFFSHPTGLPGNNLTGNGFANDTAGTLIYSATPAAMGPSGNFLTTNTTPVNLDQSPVTGTPGSGSGQQTVSGLGGSQLTFNTVFANTNYFPTGLAGTSLSFDGNNNLPFRQVSPSVQFVNLTGAGVGSTFAGFLPRNLGTLNGSNGLDVQFQSDVSSSFNPAAVPEPASIAMTLLGLGGTGLGVFASRRKAAKA